MTSTILMRRRPNKYQRLISKFLKEPDSVWKNTSLVKREMAIAKKLFLKIKDEKFWVEAHLPFQLNSLAWFLSKDGIQFLNLEAKKLKIRLPQPIKYILEEDKCGEDKEVNKPQNTIMDFLKNAS